MIAAVGKDAVAPTNNVLTFTVLTDGTLVLYPNDGKPDDNSGTGDVTVNGGAVLELNNGNYFFSSTTGNG